MIQNLIELGEIIIALWLFLAAPTSVIGAVVGPMCKDILIFEGPELKFKHWHEVVLALTTALSFIYWFLYIDFSILGL